MMRTEDFRQWCANDPILVSDIVLPMTVSIGVAAFDAESHRDGEGLYRTADAAVYRVKNTGRNRFAAMNRMWPKKYGRQFAKKSPHLRGFFYCL